MAEFRIMLRKKAWACQGQVVGDEFKRKDLMGTVLEGFPTGLLELVLNFSGASTLLENLKEKKNNCQGPLLVDSYSTRLDWGLGTGISECSLGDLEKCWYSVSGAITSILGLDSLVYLTRSSPLLLPCT